MGNRQNRTKLISDHDECELLVVGYLRNITEPNSFLLPSSNICILCRQYYLLPQLLFLNDAAFHLLNVTAPNLPILITNLINTKEASIHLEPFDVSCYIPDIFGKSSLIHVTNIFSDSNHIRAPSNINLSKARSVGHIRGISSLTNLAPNTPTNTVTIALSHNPLPSTYLPLLPLSEFHISDENEKHDAPNVNNITRFDAILTRRLKWVYTDYKHLQISYFFYLFENSEHNFDQNHGRYFMMHSPYQESVNMVQLLFADNHGIIGLDSHFNVYQLNLNDIYDEEFEFKEISIGEDVTIIWDRNRGDGCHVYPSSILLKGDATDDADIDMIFAVENVHDYDSNTALPTRKRASLGRWRAKCSVFDLFHKEWIQLADFHYCAPLEDQFNFKCGLCTNDRRRNEIYLVSNIGHIACYNFNKNEWNLIYVDFKNQEMRFDKKPIVWMYEYAPDIIYCAGCKYNKKKYKYELQVRTFDIRSGKRGK